MSRAQSAEVRAEIETRLKRLSEAFVDRYGEDLSELTLTEVEDELIVGGFVIVPRQLLMLRKEFHDWPPEFHRCVACGSGVDPPRIDVAVLSELDENDPSVETAVVDHPGGNALPVFSRRRDDELITQWLADDGPARLLRRAEDIESDIRPNARSLVQLADGTVGWCAVGTDSARHPAESDGPFVHALTAGSQWSVSSDQLRDLFEAVDEVVASNVAYRLGGREWATGVDCSAFVQRVIHRSTGALLPRHSGDQMKVGQRVARSELQPADLLFARSADRNILHVALVLPAGQVAHACRLDARVKRESVDDLLERYRYLRAQRLFIEDEFVE